eukprot:278844-Rhodomonas_salina.1
MQELQVKPSKEINQCWQAELELKKPGMKHLFEKKVSSSMLLNMFFVVFVDNCCHGFLSLMEEQIAMLADPGKSVGYIPRVKYDEILNTISNCLRLEHEHKLKTALSVSDG